MKNAFSNLIDVYLSKRELHGAFGLILYNESNPFTKKVLRDQDFWSALDAISGSRWPIFALRPQQGRYVQHYPRSDPDTISMMVDIRSEWHEPIDNEMILEYLELKDTKQMPLLLIFCRGPKKEVLKTGFRVSETDENQCYMSLKTAFEAVAESIKDVQEEFIKNDFEVYNLMKTGLTQHLVWTRMSKGADFVGWCKGLLS